LRLEVAFYQDLIELQQVVQQGGFMAAGIFAGRFDVSAASA
jgi:hypothetical protein